MKKHPVDDMFAKRLSKWEPEASPDLWNRIEARQKKAPQRLGNWYWFAAAGISVALLAGYLVWQSDSSRFGSTAQTIAQNKNQTPQGKSDSGINVTSETPELLAGTEGPGNKIENSNLKLPKSKKGIRQVRSNEGFATESEPTTMLNNIEVAAIPREEVKPEPLTIEKEEIAIQQTVEVPSIDKETESPSESRVIVAHVQIDEPEEDDQKSSKFIRILRQLKNAKQGDAVDWEEVGFNPKKLMARADERLRNEEDKIVKQYQNLKEKTKL